MAAADGLVAAGTVPADTGLPETDLTHAALANTVPDWAAHSIISAGRRLHAQGLVQATAGNLSVRVDAATLAITRSGTHKGFLDRDGVMLVDLDGAPRSVGKPSAETSLHCQIYRLYPAVGAVLHVHSVPGTVLSMASDGPIRFSGYEMLKAFAGQHTHDATVPLPVVENDQDIARLSAGVEPLLRDNAAPLGYILRGHGPYVWGAGMQQALAHVEALEFLLSCELERRQRR